MENLEELYGIYALYHTGEKAKDILNKPVDFLRECALKILKDKDPILLNIGLKNLATEDIKKNYSEDFVFNEKFIKSVEMHLIKSQEIYRVHQLLSDTHSDCNKLLKKKRKIKRKKQNFHKISLVQRHIKSNNFISSIETPSSSIPETKIFKRKPLS